MRQPAEETRAEVKKRIRTSFVLQDRKATTKREKK
jgi:hypothetical protein